MALKPCRECGKEISEQAEFCPHCGIKSPAFGPAVNSATQDCVDSPILEMVGVVVTRTLAKFQNQTFPINGIGSVTLVPPRNTGLIIFGAMLLLSGLKLMFSPWGGGLGVLFLCCSGLFFWIAFTRKHGLVIKTASGDVRAMEHSDAAVLNTVKQAIEHAATMRG